MNIRTKFFTTLLSLVFIGCTMFVLGGCETNVAQVDTTIKPDIHVVGVDSDDPKVMFEYDLGPIHIVDSLQKIEGPDAFFIAQLPKGIDVKVTLTIGEINYETRIPRYVIKGNEFLGTKTSLRSKDIWPIRDQIPGLIWRTLDEQDYDEQGAPPEAIAAYAQKLIEEGKEKGEDPPLETKPAPPIKSKPVEEHQTEPFQGKKL